jgi:hypothetical protein
VLADVPRAKEEYLGKVAFDALPDEEQETVRLQCGNHVRALFSTWGVKKEVAWLGEKLRGDLDALHNSQRIDGSVSGTIYAACKEFKDGDDLYPKGAAKAYIAWHKKHHPAEPILSLGRTKCGSKQDEHVRKSFVWPPCSEPTEARYTN